MINYFGNYTWRGILLNRIIKELNYASYLELGVSDGERCYNIVNCANKIGVDSNPIINLPNVIHSYTDDFFKTLDQNKKFDLIYIDACHEKYQVYRDFCNSLKHLNSGGMIILHDIYPLVEEDSSQDLNGDSYETWIDIVKKYPKETSTFIGYPGDREGTVGIFLKTDFDYSNCQVTDLNYSYEYFFNNLTKFIYHKTVTEDQLIMNAKCW